MICTVRFCVSKNVNFRQFKPAYPDRAAVNLSSYSDTHIAAKKTGSHHDLETGNAVVDPNAAASDTIVAYDGFDGGPFTSFACFNVQIYSLYTAFIED